METKNKEKHFVADSVFVSPPAAYLT